MVASLFLFSCVSLPKYGNNIRGSRDTARNFFIVMKDSTVHEVGKLVFHRPLFRRWTVDISDTERVYFRDVAAYQNKRGYFHRVGAGEFAPRIKKGPVNLYRSIEMVQELVTGTGWAGMLNMRLRFRYYLQKGDYGAVKPFKAKLLKEYVQDYPPALNHIKAYERKKRNIRHWSLANTGAVLGGMTVSVMGLATVESRAANVKGYIGFGLLTGGVVSGLVNKVRKLRVHKPLEHALDTYNSQVGRQP